MACLLQWFRGTEDPNWNKTNCLIAFLEAILSIKTFSWNLLFVIQKLEKYKFLSMDVIRLAFPCWQSSFTNEFLYLLSFIDLVYHSSNQQTAYNITPTLTDMIVLDRCNKFIKMNCSKWFTKKKKKKLNENRIGQKYITVYKLNIKAQY